MATPPPPKRRRVSADPDETPRRGISAPPRRSQSRTPSRPSFASPTKSTLARYNPSLLATSPRRRSRPLVAAPQSSAISRNAAQDAPVLPAIDFSLIDPALLNDPAVSRVQLEQQISEQVMKSLGQAMSDVINNNVTTGAPSAGRSRQDRLDDAQMTERASTTGPRRQNLPSLRQAASPIAFDRDAALNSDGADSQGQRDGEDSSLASIGGGPVQAPTEMFRSPAVEGRQNQADANTIDSADKAKDVPVNSQELKDMHEMREQRSKLRKELDFLHGQVNILTKEFQTLDQTAALKETQSSLLKLLNATEGDGSPADQTPSAPSLNILLNSFMPFSTPIAIPIEKSGDDDEEDTVPSCKPIDLPDPLPHLQLFSSLKLIHQAHAPTQRDKRTGTLFQRHSVRLTGPKQYLVCDLDFTVAHIVDATSDLAAITSIEQVKVGTLSMWARKAVGSWLEARAQQCDITAIGFGLGRFWDVASRRQQCWRKCVDQFHDFLQSDGSTSELSLLHRNRLTFSSPEVQLTVYWRISLNEMTSEAESNVSLRAAFPDVWHEADEARRSFSKLPKVFERLVQERGVFGAIQVVVPLALQADGEGE